MLSSLIAELRQSLGILNKQDIQVASRQLSNILSPHGTPILLGDDCAAIPDGDSYLLFAAEGMSPELVQQDPWFAGWCSILVNVSDIYAMGGRPIAVVDALWSPSLKDAEQIWEGMYTASKTFNVPIVGGHTNCHSDYAALSVAILGRATALISSFSAQVGDRLMLVTNFAGQPREQWPLCWDAATMTLPEQLRSHFELLPQFAEQGLCDAGKDISMGGIIGTALMLLETSNCGAILDLDALPCPEQIPLKQWLLSFPSYGFLLSVRPDHVADIQVYCEAHSLVAADIGTIHPQPVLSLKLGTETQPFWDLSQMPLTGFSGGL